MIFVSSCPWLLFQGETTPASTTCREDEFRCNNNECIPQENRCNHRYDCEDGSDERDCRKYMLKFISVRFKFASRSS